MDAGHGSASPPSRPSPAAAPAGAPRERMLLAAMQTSPDAFVVLDHEDRVEWWNRAAEAMFGWSVEEAAGRLLTELVVPDEYRRAHDEGLRRRAAGGRPRLGADPVQVEATCRDGRRILVELSVGELEWEGGPRFHAFIRDVTERETARRSLEVAESRSRTAFENAPVGMLLTAVTGRGFGLVIMANPAAEEMLGRTSDELRTLACSDITHPDDRWQDARMVPRLLSGAVDKLQYEKRFVRPDGRDVWVAFSATVVRDLDGTATHGIHQLVDITERRAAAQELVRLNDELRRANAQLAAANAELDRFTAAVAHDLKNPLTAILAHAELLIDSHRCGVELRGAATIVRAGARMNALIEDLLVYSRAQGADLVRERVDLDAMVADVAAELAVAMDGPVRITTGHLPALHLASVHFRQVLANLIGNGIKYVAEGVVPHVHVEAEQDPSTQHWTLRVVDNGIGIPPSARERVFEIFHREATQYPGTGVGLATCRRVVERHGGRIWVEPAPGGGTVVCVALPAGTPDAVAVRS